MEQPAVIAFSVGLVAGITLMTWLAGALVTAAAVACALLAFRKSSTVVWVMLGLALGAVRLMTFPLTPPSDDIGRLAGHAVQADGVVVANPVSKGHRQQTTVQVTQGRYSGRVLVTVPPKPRLRPGDHLHLSGSLVRPRALPGFDYCAYLAKDRMYATMPAAEVTAVTHHTSLSGSLWDIRQDFQRRLTGLFPEINGQLLLGILLGERADLPTELTRDFQRTGLTHVLALSGYNISILLVVWIGLFGRRPVALLGALTAVGLFVLMVGASASVMRAALMGGFVVISQLFGRPQTALRAIIITAAGLLLLSPWALRYDLSFDLSFAATVGITLFDPLIRPIFRRLPPLVAEAVTATLAANVFAAPLIVASFGQLSLIAPLANVVFVPAVPWLMLGGFVATGASYVAGGLAGAGAYSVNLAVTSELALVHRLSGLPIASLTITHGRIVVAVIVLVANLTAVAALYVRQRQLSWLVALRRFSVRIREVNPRRPAAPESRAAPG